MERGRSKLTGVGIPNKPRRYGEKGGSMRRSRKGKDRGGRRSNERHEKKKERKKDSEEERLHRYPAAV